jgi:hypothetical protein
MIEPEEGRWLTYVEVGQLLGISPAAARMHAKRRGWVHRTPNMHGDRARVLVPIEASVQLRSASYPEHTAHVITHDQERTNGPDQVNVRAFEQVITILHQQIERERDRVDRAERLLDEERHRIEELRTALADALTAERIAAGQAAALRAEADARRSQGLLRRLREALKRA